MNSFDFQSEQFNFFKGQLNKALHSEKNKDMTDEEFSEECENDKVAEFETTRGTDKPSKYFS